MDWKSLEKRFHDDASVGLERLKQTGVPGAVIEGQIDQSSMPKAPGDVVPPESKTER